MWVRAQKAAPESEDEIRRLIQEYNASENTEGQMIIQPDDDENAPLRFKGFLRVHIKVKQAVSVAAKLPRRLSNGKLNPSIPKSMDRFATLTSSTKRESFFIPTVVDKVCWLPPPPPLLVPPHFNSPVRP